VEVGVNHGNFAALPEIDTVSVGDERDSEDSIDGEAGIVSGERKAMSATSSTMGFRFSTVWSDDEYSHDKK
jgi:hypothetical protein